MKQRKITYNVDGRELTLTEYAPQSVTYYPETGITAERSPLYGENDYALLLTRDNTHLFFMGEDRKGNGVYDVVIYALKNRDELALAEYNTYMQDLQHITGDGTIKALRLAQDFLVHHFIDICASHNARCIKIKGICDRRLRAYTRLKKYGFKQFEDCPYLLVYPFTDDVVGKDTIYPPDPKAVSQTIEYCNYGTDTPDDDPFASPF